LKSSLKNRKIKLQKMTNKNKILAITLLGFLLLVLNLNLALGQIQGNKLEKFLDVLKNLTKSKPPSQTNPQGPELFLNVPLYKPVLDYEKAVVNVVEKSSAAVVSIIISKDVPVFEQIYLEPFGGIALPPEFKDFFQFEFPQLPQLKQKGTERQKIGGGSGFIISADGMILTNKHVVADKDAEYAIYLNDGRKFNAKVLALHPIDDLAVVKIEANDLPYLYLGNSDNLKLGQGAIAIGNALGEFQNTVSVGVISGLKRSIIASDNSGAVEKLEGLIQTDAAINPGNSGGPLLNLRGEVIAINTAIVSGAQNIGFAIPVNRAKKILVDLKLKGKIEVAFLGVRYVSINEEVQKKFNLPFAYGAYVYSKDKQEAIFPDSPAAKAGLKTKDIILEANDQKITLQNSLAQIITSKNVGEKLRLKIWRDGKIFMVEILLAALPSNVSQ
jgi:S1-C subfamily serine protease